MDFQSGVFVRYKALSKIHLGSIQQDLFEETVVEFDGQTLRMGGKEYEVPALRGAVTMKWLVPVNDNVSRYISQPSGVRVRPAQPGRDGFDAMAVETTADEDVVGTLKESQNHRAEALRSANTSLKATVTKAEDPPEEIDYGLDAAAVETPAPKPAPRPAFTTPVKTMMQVVAGDEQEAVPVARFGTPASQKVVLSDISQAVNKFDGGRTAKVEKIGSVKKSQTVAEGTPIDDRPGGTTGDVTETRSGETLEELLPDAASAGSPSKFAWDKSIHWRKRVAEALDYVDQPVVLKHILDIEDPSVVKHIKSELVRKGLPVPE